ncbi:MAG: ShlB/FhaC/HecB family hemolysin secretion/activation protein, partial [Comamonas sp.]
ELAAPLLAEKPLRSATFQHQTQLMARIPGVRIAASAQLPTTTDGATTLVLTSSHQPFTFSLGADLRQGQSKALATV